MFDLFASRVERPARRRARRSVATRPTSERPDLAPTSPNRLRLQPLDRERPALSRIRPHSLARPTSLSSPSRELQSPHSPVGLWNALPHRTSRSAAAPGGDTSGVNDAPTHERSNSSFTHRSPNAAIVRTHASGAPLVSPQGRAERRGSTSARTPRTHHNFAERDRPHARSRVRSRSRSSPRSAHA